LASFAVYFLGVRTITAKSAKVVAKTAKGYSGFQKNFQMLAVPFRGYNRKNQ
jgi:hypothetical protein